MNINKYFSKITALNKKNSINSELLKVYESHIDHYIDTLIKSMTQHCKTFKTYGNIKNRYNINNKYIDDYDELIQFSFPYYYINFLDKIMKNKLNTNPILFSIGNDLKSKYDAMKKRGDNRLILIERYLGMGHYLVLSALMDEINEDRNNPVYYVYYVGGSNGLDRAASWHEYNNLNKQILVKNNKLKPLKDAIHELLTSNPFDDKFYNL